jgi:nicotinamidase-related amidase
MIRGLNQNEHAALVISECQRGVLDPALAIFPGLAEQSTQRQTLRRIATLARLFRSCDLPVIHIHVAHRLNYQGFARRNPVSGLVAKQGRMLEGTAQVQSMPEVHPEGNDVISLRHNGVGMWYGTDLDATLRNMSVETIVFTGVSTNLAIMLGAAGAADRGYSAVVVEDAIAGASAESHRWIVNNSIPMLASMASVDALVSTIGRQPLTSHTEAASQ